MSVSTPSDGHPERVVIRDKRRVDPVSGQARKPDPEPAVAESADVPAVEESQTPLVEAALLDERTRDLQRLQAEYANYRKRMERDRVAIRDLATGDVLAALLPVLDDIDRARSHNDLDGAFKAVAEQLEGLLDKLGLEPFGAVGDLFDPAWHEAVMHNESDDVTEPTTTTIMRRGYRHGDRLLRAALVGVTDPLTPAADPPPDLTTELSAEVGAPEGTSADADS